jgi:hypothetical protein
MRKFLVIAIPVVALVLFILVMLSGDFLKESFGSDDNIPKSLEIVTQDIANENWEAAKVHTENLSTAWNKVIQRVQYSSERDEINAFSMNLARLRGAILAQDKNNGLTELSEAYEHWNELGN